ncbi:MAG: hypothetical protein JXQ75_01435 [Phycisphaerae bacterium]|nr:hypothetical protein [Phycisphaerae bacterium]
MKCFNHLGVDAVGLCMACGRGLCGQRVVDLDRGLACKDRCEHEVRRLLDLRDFSLAQPHLQENVLSGAKNTSTISGLSGIAIGAVMVAYGLLVPGNRFIMLLGAVIAAFGLTTLTRSLMRRKVRADQFRLCPRCGYNVTGNTIGKCPECGFTI